MGLPVLSDSAKKSPSADESYRPSSLETLRPTLRNNYRKSSEEVQMIKINPEIIVFRTVDLRPIIAPVS